MKIYKGRDIQTTDKPEGIRVKYFFFDEYEVHYNEQLPHTTQTWHHHENIWESIYMIFGKLTAEWMEEGRQRTERVEAGDLIESEFTPHTFINDSNETVRFLVIKQVLTGENKREVFKKDKILDSSL